MFAAGMFGAFLGASGTLAYYEVLHMSGSRRVGDDIGGKSAPPSKAVSSVRSEPAASDRVVAEAGRFGFPQGGAGGAVVGVGSPEPEYFTALDRAKRIPNWVLEYFGPSHPIRSSHADGADKKKKKSGGDRSKSHFHTDKSVLPAFRATPSDYSSPEAGGLSRGHLAAAQFHKSSQPAIDATFNLSGNIVPQEMSQNGCDWYRLESMSLKMTSKFPNGFWVVSGPLFRPVTIPTTIAQRVAELIHLPFMPGNPNLIPSAASNPARKYMVYPVIGPHNVAVPTHMFKVLFGEKADGSTAVAAFVMPNAPIRETKPLTAYQVPVADLESETGISFFPWKKNAAAAKAGAAGDAPFVPTESPSAVVRGSKDMCRVEDCNASTGKAAKYAALYRELAVLRSAKSLPELEKAFGALKAEAGKAAKGGGGAGDLASLETEFAAMKAKLGGGAPQAQH